MKGKMIEIEPFQNWICIECGTLVVARGRPSLRWDDGHDCIFVLEKLGQEEEEGPFATEYPLGTPLRCNQCRAKFQIDKPVMVRKVNLVFSTAHRLEERIACSECGEVDLHWIYTSDTTRIPRR